jgi:transcriptional regulator with XRE-family HTH domain
MEMKPIGPKIRQLRLQRYWTQQQFAELCNFPGPWTISRIETRGTDSLQTLEIVCKALGLEVWELLHPTRIDEMLNTAAKREKSFL